MKTFAVYKNGKIPTRQEWRLFTKNKFDVETDADNFFGTWKYKNFDPSPVIDDSDQLLTLTTDLYTESELDSLSIDWEFIYLT